MIKSIQNITVAIIFAIGLTLSGYTNFAFGQKKPPPRKEKRVDGVKRGENKTDTWRQRKFKEAVDDKTVERKSSERDAPKSGTTTKGEKWRQGTKLERGKHNKRFNDAAKPPVPSSNTGGGKKGDGSTPPSAPRQKPNSPGAV